MKETFETFPGLYNLAFFEVKNAKVFQANTSFTPIFQTCFYVALSE